MPLTCNCYEGCWVDHAKKYDWNRIEIPEELFNHPTVAEKKHPASFIKFILSVPDWYNYDGQPWAVNFGSSVIEADVMYVEEFDQALFIRKRVNHVLQELGLSEPVHLYLESHITIEPVFDGKRETAAAIAKKHGFKLADLLMKKDREASEERSDKDTFMTGHGVDYASLATRMSNLVRNLHNLGFEVWRYKIENTICDSRNFNALGLPLTQKEVELHEEKEHG